MIRSILFFLPIFLLWACGSGTQSSEQAPEQPQWRSLFNGEDLDGWVWKINGYELNDNYANTFRVEESLLKISYDDYERYDQRFGALYYDEAFENYRLKVEYRFVGDTAHAAPNWGFRDSGIQYHGQSPQSVGKDQYFPVCLEFNLHGGDGEKERPNGQICTIGTKVQINGELNSDFCTMPSISRTFHGDQWVTAEIEVKGDSISHWLNGEQVLAFSAPQYDPNHDLGKTFIQGDTVGISSGYISLQSNSHPIQFRKIEILEY